MAFFDVNIPIDDEPKDKNRAKHAKDTRVKLVVKAMELGYSGIAFNRSVSGVISDSDRCTIPTLPLQSLLEASPALAETVRFHREVLGVPVGETFKQYTRLTVGVESILQAAAISPLNPVLRGYDLVAVRPMDQQTFEHACKNLEVDLISIDFSQRLPFHTKSALVKAAVERGIFF
jgi:ribonuclease P/MRP protein subunit RPP1